MTPEILILYYSRHGSTLALAQRIAAGVDSAGGSAVLRTVPDVSTQIGEAPPVPDSGAPYVSRDDLDRCAGLALGSPTRFGNMAAPMKHFWDSTSSEWLSGALIGKPASVFTASSSLHGGQETTLLTMMIPLLHHGMLIMGLPYSEPALSATQSGGTPYGVTHVSTQEHRTELSKEESELAYAQGKRLSTLSKTLLTQDEYV